MLSNETLALIHVMRTFLIREGLKFKMTETDRKEKTVYMKVYGPHFPYTLRFGDHPVPENRHFARQPDFDIKTYEDLVYAEWRITQLTKNRITA